MNWGVVPLGLGRLVVERVYGSRLCLRRWLRGDLFFRRGHPSVGGRSEVRKMERKLTDAEDKEIRRLLALLGERSTPVDLVGELRIWDADLFMESLRGRTNVRL